MDLQETPIDFEFETGPQAVEPCVRYVTERTDIVTEDGHFQFRFRHCHTPAKK